MFKFHGLKLRMLSLEVLLCNDLTLKGNQAFLHFLFQTQNSGPEINSGLRGLRKKKPRSSANAERADTVILVPV